MADILNLDFLSVQITVGAMLMLNSQFVCELNGKRLKNYIEAKDFVDMVHSYTKIKKEQFPE